jgi:OTU-like cysteine protease
MHMVLRRLAVQQLVSKEQHYRRFVPVSYEVYCSEMSMRSTWGDHITLQALADAVPMQVNVVTSSGDATITEILPADRNPERVVWLALLSECHYTSLYPRDRLKARQRGDRKCVVM